MIYVVSHCLSLLLIYSCHLLHLECCRPGNLGSPTTELQIGFEGSDEAHSFTGLFLITLLEEFFLLGPLDLVFVTRLALLTNHPVLKSSSKDSCRDVSHFSQVPDCSIHLAQSSVPSPLPVNQANFFKGLVNSRTYTGNRGDSKHRSGRVWMI